MFINKFINILLLLVLLPVVVSANPKESFQSRDSRDKSAGQDISQGTRQNTHDLSNSTTGTIIRGASTKTPVEPIVRENISAQHDEAIKKVAEKNNKLLGPPKPEFSAAIVIPPAFERVREFHKGSAPVRVDGKWGLINTKGEWILAPTFSEIGQYNEEGILPVKVAGKYGYIDSTGTPITDFKYDAVRPFSEGLAAVKIDDQWGYILPDGQEFIEEGFEDAGLFKQGVAPIKFAEGWGYALLEWSEGKSGRGWLLDPLYQQTYEFSDSHGVIKVEHMMGLVDLDKNIVIKPSFLGMKKYTEGLLPVSNKLGEWFFVDNKGETVIGETFEAVSSFSEGLASVKKNGKWGYINKFNDVIIPYKFDRAYDFNDGIAVVAEGDDRFFIDQQGRALSEKFADVYRVSEGYAAVRVGEQWGYVFIPPARIDGSMDRNIENHEIHTHPNRFAVASSVQTGS